MDLKAYIDEVPNWPIDGVTFRDMSPLLANHQAFAHALNQMHRDFQPDYWVGLESRGFIFASAMAQQFGGGCVLIRKGGKLPPPVMRREYALEYGHDVIEMKQGQGSVVLVDDLLATGGTLTAAHELCNEAGYDVIGATVLMDLVDLHPTDYLLGDHVVHSVLQY